MNTIPTIENFSIFLKRKRKEKLVLKLLLMNLEKYANIILPPDKSDTFCLEADILASKMIEENNIDFAGIILSSLCKITQFIPEQLENFALKGLHVARINKDPIHIMARLNDLRKLYFRRPEKLYEYVQVLYQQEKMS